jgi:hypothetical protein
MFDEMNRFGKHADFMAFYGDECDDPRDPVARRIAVRKKGNVCFGGKGGDAPDPNPGMLASADAAREIAQVQKQTADETLNFYKQQYAEMKPMIQEVMQNDMNIAKANAARADEYAQYERETFRPLEKNLVKDAEEYSTEGKREALATKAAADVNTGFTNAREQEGRALSRMGVNPNSGRFAALNKQLTLGQAATSAGAMTKARDDAEQLGFARRMDVTQLGRGLAGNASTAYGVSMGAGEAARNSAIAGGNFMGGGYGAAQAGYSGAANSYGTAGNIYGQEFQGRMQGYQAQQQASSSAMSGIGSMIGTGIGAYMSGGLSLAAAAGKKADGGIIRKANGGKVTRRALKLADGTHVGAGPVAGPGGPVDDKVPALLSDGEYVLPADTAAKIGKDKLDKLVDKTHTPAAVQRKRKALKGKK